MQQLIRFKYWLYILVGLGVSIGAAAQTTTVSGTVTDQGGQVWAHGTLSYVFQNNGSFSGPYQWNGGNLPNQYLTPQIVTLGSGGTFSIVIPTSTAIAPALSTWRYVVCPNASAPCAILTVPSSGNTQNISSQITAAAATLVTTIQAGPMPLAYTDAEIITTPNQGGIYFNVTSFLPKYFDGTSWQFYGSGGGGGVTFINGVSGSFTFTGSGVSCTGTTCTFNSGGSGIPTTPTNALVKINGSGGSASSLFDSGTAITTGEPITAANFNGVVLTTGAGTTTFLNGAGSYVLATGSPTGTAGGDLAGTYPNPTVAQVNGAVVPISAPVLGTNSSKQLIDVSTNPFVYSSINLPHWRLALARVKHGTGNARFCAVGDSTTSGFFANGPSSGNSNLYSYPTQLANILQSSYGIKSQSQGVFNGGQGLPGGADPRLSFGSSWSGTGALGGIPNGTLTATTSTNAASFTPSVPVDTFRLLYVVETTEGTGNVNIDGGSPTSFTATGSAAVGILTVTAGSVGTHTLNVFESSGSVHIIGFEAYNSTTNQIIIENIGAAGVKAADLAVTTKPYNSGTATMYAAIGCDIVNLNDGLNDWGTGVSVSTYSANIQIVINAVKGGGSDIILESPNHSDPATGIASEATQSTFVEALRTLATNNSENNLPNVPLPFDDTWNRWQTFAISSALGLYGDPAGTPSEHPGTVGYREKADQIAQMIAQAPSQNNGQWDYRTLFQVNVNTQTLIAKYQLSAPNYTDTGLLSASCVGTNASGLFIVGSCTGTGTVTSIATTSPIGGGTITTTGTITCTTCVVASSPGVGIAHFAGGTQTVTSSLVDLGADVSGNLPNANLASQTANTVLGALTATTPSGLAMPSCSGASNALIWTSGVGFGCNTITGGSAAFSALTSGTNTAAAMIVGAGASLNFTSTGTINASTLSGLAITGAGAAIPTCPTVSINNDLLAFQGTVGQCKDSGIASTNVATLSGTQTISGSKNFSLMLQGAVSTVASATTVSPTTPIVIFSGITTISTITPPTGTGAVIGTSFDFTTSGILVLTTGGNIGSPAITTVVGTLYHCTFFGTTNGNWFCK